jgi:ubiquinone biosynthesis O-methyltransferase
VVEHVSDVDLFLKSCGQLVRPGGMMVAATLNRTARSFALAIVGVEYVLRWLPRGTHDWKKFLRPSELSRGLRSGGLAVREIVLGEKTREVLETSAEDGAPASEGIETGGERRRHRAAQGFGSW